MPRPLPLLLVSLALTTSLLGCGSDSTTKASTAKASSARAAAVKKHAVGSSGYDIIPEGGQSTPTVDSVGAEPKPGFVVVAQSPNPRRFPDAFGEGGLEAILSTAEERHINLGGGGSVTWNWFAPPDQAAAAREIINSLRVRYGISIQVVGG